MKVVTFISILTYITVVSGETTPLVTIPSLGQLEGNVGRSLNGRTFFSFEGVPYARPPVGKYRFREPVPPKPWHGVWIAKTIYKCIQCNQYVPQDEDCVIGTEDCLYLNIYTPNLNAQFDVIIYIHGGAFMFNYGGLQGPAYLLDKDVVYVNLNYRLGPLGFLSTENDIVPGNNGMKDQILALQWIKDNIKHFGGNPNSITISGMSAGGASVHFHYLSPKSLGLFNRGISQSGTMLNPWVLMEKPLEKSKKLATAVGCSTRDVKQMVDCLKRRPAHQIVASVKHFQPWLYNPFSPFGIVVDSWVSNPSLPDHPYNLIKNRKLQDLPWIASYTGSEGLYPAADFYYDHYLADIDTRWNELMPFILDYNYTVDPELQNEVSQRIRQHYLGEQKLTKSTFMSLVNMISDRIFVFDIEKCAKLQASVTTSSVYSYYFTYRGAHSKSESRAGTDKNFGAAHGDDTSYVFQTKVNTTSTENDKLMIKLFVNMFTSFAKMGKPEVSIEWKPVSKNVQDELSYLKISSPVNLTLVSGDLGNTKFWDSLAFKENENLFPGFKDEL